VLLEQTYSSDDDRNHILSLIPTLSDPRYLRIEGKLALFIYRADLLPDAASTANIWREEVRNAGFGELFLGAFVTKQVDLESWGFDVAVEFVPYSFKPTPKRFLKRLSFTLFAKLCARLNGAVEPAIHLYGDLVDSRIESPPPNGTAPENWLRCVTPAWDNSPRKKKRPIIFLGSTPRKYGEWLKRTISWTAAHIPKGRRFVFINAWNEWAEGNHLEPDRKYGRAYLEATQQALKGQNID
jgi:hypothetical protein